MNQIRGKLHTFEEMQQLVMDFEKVLTDNNIEIIPGSDLEWICLKTIQILAMKEKPVLQNPLEDIRPYFVDVLGLWGFMLKIVRMQTLPGFHVIKSHLELLNKGKVPQNSRLPITDQASDKIFELLIALCALEAGEKLTVDDPNKSKGTNPDILVTMNGCRWGFACKVIYGKNPKTIYDNISQGVSQIENSEAEIGCVILNLKNHIPHEDFWPILNEHEVRQGREPIFGVYPYYQTIPVVLSYLATQKRDAVIQDVGLDQVRATFVGKKAIPGFLAFMQTVTTVNSKAGPIPTSIDMFTMADFDDVSPAMPVLNRLNDALHDSTIRPC